jgi:DNA-binding transcriptional MerR regulator
MSGSERLRIRDLEQRSGVSRQTIHYYLREGLLQAPIEKNRNSAWYDESHLARLLLIRDLKENSFLPLKAIRAVIAEEESPAEFTAAQQNTIDSLRDTLRQREHQRSAQQDLSALVEEIRFTQAEIEQLSGLGWIHPRQGGGVWRVNDIEAQLLRAWATVRDAGLTPARGFQPRDFEVFDSLLGELAEQLAVMLGTRLGSLGAADLETLYDRLVPALNSALGQTHAVKLVQALTRQPPSSDIAPG